MSENTIQLGRAIEGDGHYRAKGFEWMLLCPHLGSSDKVALMLLCGLAREGHQRNLTLEEIGDFLTSGPVDIGEEPKRMSVSGVAKVLNRLSALGQLTGADGKPIKVSNRMTSVLRLIPYRLPRHTCGASRNVYDALARIRNEEPMWALATVDASEAKITPRRVYKRGLQSGGAHKSVPDAQDSVPRAHKSVQDKPLTSENGPFLGSTSGSSSLFEGAPEDAPSDGPPEADREEEEIENDDNDNPSAEPRAHLPQEREGEEMEIKDSQAPDGAVGASVDVQAFIASLPGVTGQQAAVQGQFEASIAAALGRGFTLDTLRAALVEHTDWKKARDPKVIPTWYLNAFDKIKDPPPVPVALCDNPAHARQPMPDPINGGCLPCNTLAARGPITKTALQPEQTVELDGDAVTARAAMRKALAERKFVGDTRSRKQTPAQRMSDEADTNRVKANALLSTEA